MSPTPKSLFILFNNGIKSTDIYGQPISLNYKGSTHFKTTIGGFVTIISLLFILWYATIQVIEVFARSKTFISQNVISKNLMLDDEINYISEDNFTFLIGAHTRHPSVPNIVQDPTYLNVSYTFYDIQRDDLGAFDTQTVRTTDMGSVKCHDFKGQVSDELASKLALDTFWCPGSDSWGIGGSTTGLYHRYLQASIKK